MLHWATFLATCLAIVLTLRRNWELFSNDEFLLAACSTYLSAGEFYRLQVAGLTWSLVTIYESYKLHIVFDLQ